MDMYGRHRESIADIEQQLYALFADHPLAQDANGVPKIPANALVDVLKSYSDLYDGTELLAPEEMAEFKTLVASGPGLQVSPEIVLQFVAARTKASPSPPRSPEEGEVDLPQRGRDMDRDDQGHIRSSSRDSNGTTVIRSGLGSRSPSSGPPQTPKHGTFFESSRRQRTTPLAGAVPPSTWTRRPPPHRRKSDAGSRSDSEYSESPTAFRRGTSRTRAPSNPTSPSAAGLSPDFRHPTFSPATSPQSSSRPHSRARSQPQNVFNNSAIYDGYSSPDDSGSHSPHDSFANSVSSLPMPRGSSSDSDDENDGDSAMGLVLDRSTASSTVSMEESERAEALKRTNIELSRKLREAENSMIRRLAEHDEEIQDLNNTLEELKSELNAAKKEEKEVRSKERQAQQQISALEAEVAKMTRSLDQARASYSSLQKLYAEQCAASEKYRDDLRQREELVRSLREAAQLSELEQSKWVKEQHTYEERILRLQDDLALSNEVNAQLDEQKQENLLLKETIDRMRFDMDEMRNNLSGGAGGTGPASGQNSAANTISKSLGAELLGKMKGGWGMEDETEEEEVEETVEDEDTEGEDVIQTIITRKKRKVTGRGNKVETHTFEETKEYKHGSTQYETEDFFITSSTQTDPEPKILTASINIQTDENPEPEPVPVLVELPRVTIDMEIQTDEIAEDSRSPSPDEALASSSSTIIPPTPKAHLLNLEPTDSPPAYQQSEEEVERMFLKKWHHGVHTLLDRAPNGVSEDIREEWKTIKEELGVECLVIDKIIENSATRPPPPNPKPGDRKSGRFYNIYNTYIYPGSGGTNGFASGAALAFGLSTMFIVFVSPYLVPHYSVPGGPTYYDRTAWNSFNSMQVAGEGFAGGDGTAAVWNFLGRVGDGAARMARGWPT